MFRKTKFRKNKVQEKQSSGKTSKYKSSWKEDNRGKDGRLGGVRELPNNRGMWIFRWDDDYNANYSKSRIEYKRMMSVTGWVTAVLSCFL